MVKNKCKSIKIASIWSEFIFYIDNSHVLLLHLQYIIQSKYRQHYFIEHFTVRASLQYIFASFSGVWCTGVFNISNTAGSCLVVVLMRNFHLYLQTCGNPIYIIIQLGTLLEFQILFIDFINPMRALFETAVFIVALHI